MHCAIFDLTNEARQQYVCEAEKHFIFQPPAIALAIVLEGEGAVSDMEVKLFWPVCQECREEMTRDLETNGVG